MGLDGRRRSLYSTIKQLVKEMEGGYETRRNGESGSITTRSPSELLLNSGDLKTSRGSNDEKEED